MGGVWAIGSVETRGVFPKTYNRYQALMAEDGEEVEVHAVEARSWTRTSGLIFNVADVRKPLAAAAKVVEAGNRVVLDPEGSYVENIKTKEKMKLRKEKGVYVIDVKYENGDEGAITLDSGAGVSVWPKNWKTDAKMMPKKKGLKMIAANGTSIENIGQKVIKFRGEEAPHSCFTGRS